MGAYEAVEKLESMRKKRNTYAKLVILCVFSPMIIMFLSPILGLSELAPVMCMFIVVGGVFFCAGQSGKLTKEYKKMYKEHFVVNVLNEVFDNVTYDYREGFDRNYVRQFGLTRLGNRFRSEDYLRAIYKGINFEQSDVVIQYHTSGKNSHTTTYFRGRMFTFDFPYKSVQSVQVFTESYPYRAEPVANGRTNRITMESQLFNKEFDVTAINEHDAFYVLTPQMMEKIQGIKQQYNHVAMHFKGNKLYVGIWTTGDSFDGDLRRPINYMEEKEATLRDAHVITGIIDALGMMKEEGADDMPEANPSDYVANEDYMANTPEAELANILRDNGLSNDDFDKIMSVGNMLTGGSSGRGGLRLKL